MFIEPYKLDDHLLSKINVDVLSKSNPEPALLCMVRRLIQNSKDFNHIFNSGTANRNELRKVLQGYYPEDPEVDSVAEYLCDEYEQIGDGILLISSQTGKAFAKLTDEDFYKPSPVLREDYSLEDGNVVRRTHQVERKVTIRPEILGFIFQWSSERDREKNIKNTILSRINQTDLLREEGDSRILFSSKEGRSNIALQIYKLLPTIFQYSKGTSKDFLMYLVPGKPLPNAKFTEIRRYLNSSACRSIKDLLSFNIKYSILNSTLFSTAEGWIRLIGEILFENSSIKCSTGISINEIKPDGFWIAEPDLASKLKSVGCNVLFVKGPENTALHFNSPIGFMDFVGDSFGVKNEEIHDNWTIDSRAEINLWIDWLKITVYSIPGDFKSSLFAGATINF